MPSVMVPTRGLYDHVTLVSEVPLTRGMKVALWPPLSDALPGDKLRLMTPPGAGLATGFDTSGTPMLLSGCRAVPFGWIRPWLVAARTGHPRTEANNKRRLVP